MHYDYYYHHYPYVFLLLLSTDSNIWRQEKTTHLQKLVEMYSVKFCHVILPDFYYYFFVKS